MTDFYSEEIMDHYRDPRNYGELIDATVRHIEKNQMCGDTVEVFLKVEGGIVADVRWKGEACAICRAGASMTSEIIKNKNIIKLGELRGEDLLADMGMGDLSPIRIRCALLGWEATKRALELV